MPPTPAAPPEPAYDLYGYWRSSATYRVRVALALKGLSWRERFVDIDAGEHRGPAFLQVNPMGAIPALVPAGQPPITQSMAILEYLEELHPAPALLPPDAAGRARVRAIAGLLAADTHPLVTPRIRKVLQGEAGYDADRWKAWQTRWFHAGLGALEQRLAAEPQTGDFCHGDQPTMADVVLASILAVMRVFKVPTQDTPTVDRIVARCDALEAFRNADPYRQAGAPVA